MPASPYTWKWRITWIVLIMVYLCNMAYYGRWKSMVTGGGDSWGYYAYLPASMIHHDLFDLQRTLAVKEKMHKGSTYMEDGLRRVYEAPIYNGKNIIKYTYGVAAMHVPAFLIAHVFASMSTKYPADGFSRPYILALYLSTLLYLLAGLFLVGRFLLRYFGDVSVMLTILILGLATNLFYFGVINNVMAHPILFFLWAALISISDAFYRRPSVWKMTLAGLVTGLIVVIRPAEAFCILIPCFYGVTRWREIAPRFKAFFTKWRLHILAGITAAAVAMVPQMLYWHKLSGKWVYYSYPGEEFDFKHPRILDGLFAFSNGWLVYSPVMIFALIGFWFLWKKSQPLALLMALLILMHIYVAYSWWNWNYINGFGSRPMVDVYALLAFPLAACVQYLWHSRIRYVVLPIWICLAGLNIFQMYQLDKGIVVSELMNKAYYLQSFGKTRFTQSMNVALDLNTYQFSDIYPRTPLVSQDFESIEHPHINAGRASEGKQSYLINVQEGPDQIVFEMRYEDMKINSPRRKYLMIRTMVFVERQIGGFFDYDTFFIDVMRGDEIRRRTYLRLNNKPGDVGQNSIWWGEIHRWYPLTACIDLPDTFSPGDRIVIYPHNQHPESMVYIDDLQIDLATR